MPWRYQYTQKNTCITFVQCWPSVFDVGPALYKYYTNVLCLLGGWGGLLWTDNLAKTINLLAWLGDPSRHEAGKVMMTNGDELTTCRDASWSLHVVTNRRRPCPSRRPSPNNGHVTRCQATRHVRTCAKRHKFNLTSRKYICYFLFISRIREISALPPDKGENLRTFWAPEA